MESELVSSEESLLALMNIRNEVRTFMTGSQDVIDWESQKLWFQSINHNLIKIWIYKEGTEWVGYGQLRIEPTGGIVYGVTSHAVTESFRGKGCGEKILRDLVQSARDLGCDAMRAEIFKSNAASLGQVYKLGYKNSRDMGDIVEVQLPL